jgi:hypothetical protein
VRHGPAVRAVNTSLDWTRPSIPVTSRTLLTNRSRRPPREYSLRFSTKTTKSMAPAISMWVASTGSRSEDWMA